MSAELRKFFIRWPRKPKGMRRLVTWHHRTESSGWWADEIVWAESAEEAVQRIAASIDIKEHTSHHDGHRMKMRVYEVPEEYQEFTVGPVMEVRHAG